MSSHRRVRRLISLLPPLLALSLGPAAGLGVAQPAAATPTAGGPQAAPKVLRLASRTAETGFDMAQVQDTHSRSIIEAIFEAPLRYDFLARPHVIRTNTAARMPEVNAEATRFVFDIQPGIRFTDHPESRNSLASQSSSSSGIADILAGEAAADEVDLPFTATHRVKLSCRV